MTADTHADIDALQAKVDAEADRWIAAFGAQDLTPKVTPESLAKWVFRDVEQQLEGLKESDAKLDAATLESEQFQKLYEDAYRRTAESDAKLAAFARVAADHCESILQSRDPDDARGIAAANLCAMGIEALPGELADLQLKLMIAEAVLDCTDWWHNRHSVHRGVLDPTACGCEDCRMLASGRATADTLRKQIEGMRGGKS